MTDTSFVCDESRLPVVVVQWPSTWRDLQEMEAALATMSACRRHGQVAFVIDVRAAHRPSTLERAVIARVMRDRQHDRGASNVVALALVTESLTAQGFLLALSWLAGRPYPMESFRTLDAAIAWAAGHKA